MTATESRPTQTYEVGGVRLDRPFKIRRLGHFGFNVDHVPEALHFYSDLLGFMISDESTIGSRLAPEDRDRFGSTAGYFTRHGGDHHSFVLFPRRVLEHLSGKSSGEVTINQITWQVGSLREVGDAVDY